VLGSSLGNPNEDLYSYPSVDLPTYPLVYPSETDTQIFDSNQNIVDDLEEQHRLITARLESIVEAKNLNTKLQIVEKTIIEPITLEISTGQIILGEPQIDNPFEISKSLDKFGLSSKSYNKESVNLDDFTDSPPIRTIRGSTSGSRKNKSTDSHSSSSFSKDIGDRSDKRLIKELGEGSARPPNPPNPPYPPNSPDSSFLPPPPPPPPPDTVSVEVNPMANPNRPLSIAAYPIFYGLPGTDPDMHVSRFLAVCAANRVLNQDYLRTFPVTLDGIAFSWYQRQPDFVDWNALRNAFIAQYRPLGFRESLIERLKNIRMGVQESVDSFYGRMQDVLNRWGNHQVPDEMLKNIFVGGLWPAELKIFVKKRRLADLTNAYQTAKTWEEAEVDEDFLPYAEITSFPTNKPQPRNTAAVIQATLRPEVESYSPQAIVVAKDSRDSKITNKMEDQMMEKLNKLTNQFSEMKVNMAGNLNKRPKPTNTRTNAWCTNCQGHGHMNNEFPSPQNRPPKCSYCNEKHETAHCWNLHGKSINQVTTNNSNRPWVNNPNKRPFTIPNIGPPYQPNDGRPRWNDTYNGPPVWNGPPTNPQTHRYGPY
jgi:hypothetical protein